MTDSNHDPARLYESKPCEPRTPHAESGGIHVVLDLNIDLTLLQKQKRALVHICMEVEVNHEQKEAAEGLLNLIDFIQDSILEQGLATEQQVFPRLP